jgi:hypothetical protein
VSNPVTITDLVLGNPNSTEDVKIKNNFANIKTWISGPALGADDIASNAITSAKIADSAVDTAEIAALAVTDSKLAVGAVTTDKIASGVVPRGKMRPFATPTYVTSLPTSWAGTLTAASGATTLTVATTTSGSFTVGTLVSLVSGSGLPSDTIVTAVGSGTITVNRATTAALSGASATAGPQSGDEVFYAADSTNGILWHLRYRSVADGGNATYPWEYVGGPQLTASSTSGSPNQYWQKSGSLLVTVPLAGLYEFELSAGLYAENIGGSAANFGTSMTLTWPTKLTNAITTTSATSMVVTNADAVRVSGSSYSTYAFVDSEIVKITGRSGTTLTITRAQLGSTAATHAASAPVYIIPGVDTATTGIEHDGLTAVGYGATGAKLWSGSTRKFRFTGLEAGSIPTVVFTNSNANVTGAFANAVLYAQPVRVSA